MTLATNARLAGVTNFVYLAAGIGALALAGRPAATGLLALITSFCALVLGVTMYAITRGQDRDLAMMAMICRVLEAAPGPGEIYFAVGSLIFSWLLLRGRMIPAPLAWLGVLASAAMVVILPATRAGLFAGLQWSSSVTWIIWLPMLVFELTLGVWLLARGVAAPIATASR